MLFLFRFFVCFKSVISNFWMWLRGLVLNVACDYSAWVVSVNVSVLFLLQLVLNLSKKLLFVLQGYTLRISHDDSSRHIRHSVLLSSNNVRCSVVSYRTLKEILEINFPPLWPPHIGAWPPSGAYSSADILSITLLWAKGLLLLTRQKHNAYTCIYRL